MTVGEALELATRRLAEAGVEAARLDARLLLASVAGMSATAVLRDPERVLSIDAEAAFGRLVERRCRREPVSRILGRREFWSLDFAVSLATLDPRPDSETVVEAALARFAPEPPRRVLDLGSGSGCLLLAVLSERPGWTGLGIDIAPDAVAVARANARTLGLDARARFQAGDWDQGLVGPFDLILSNPPYIPSREVAGLAPEVSLFEPRRALDGGSDGLDAYRALAPAAARLLAPRGCAVLELGGGQIGAVAALMATAGLAEIERRRDLAGIERCLVLGRSGS
ncbi:MAG: peptide chain release factor N(5)-glutamine methyltransferase [Alphaproteobacteria bacterium]|nr:peptide chain release factor N(5)-glutamine methyltransferase [Alphaproteobacteria bacterium]